MILLVLCNIYLYGIWLLYISKRKYICSKDGNLIQWRHHMNKCFHNPIANSATTTGLNVILYREPNRLHRPSLVLTAEDGHCG